MELSPQVLESLKLIAQKYGSSGQDFESYLEGLLYSNSLNYWDYIHLDTLLSIQNTRTDLHDEKIFITYHQITELYFSLILHEMNVLCDTQPQQLNPWLKALDRMNRYFEQLIQSFDIMTQGLDKEQFLKFRMSLLPASGFQSVQYREIEISSAPLHRLVTPNKRRALLHEDLRKQYENLYWKYGNLSLKSGEKTLTLKQFEQRYDEKLYHLAKVRQTTNLAALVAGWPEAQSDQALKEALSRYDDLANVQWPRAHMKAAVSHLHQQPEVIKATGGTNWQKYLLTKKQTISFFHDLELPDAPSDTVSGE